MRGTLSCSAQRRQRCQRRCACSCLGWKRRTSMYRGVDRRAAQRLQSCWHVASTEAQSPRAEKAAVSAPGSLAEAHMVHVPACTCGVEGDYLQSSHHDHHTILGVGTLSARSERRLKMRRSAAGAAQGPRRRSPEASACSGRLGGWDRRCRGCRPRQRQGRRRRGGTPSLALGRCRRRHLEWAATPGALRLGWRRARGRGGWS